MAGVVRDLLSLICSADVIPGRYDVVRFIMGNSPDHIPRLERFGDSKFRALLAERFPETGYGARHDFRGEFLQSTVCWSSGLTFPGGPRIILSSVCCDFCWSLLATIITI